MPANEVCSYGLALVAQKLADTEMVVGEVKGRAVARLKITVRPIAQWESERHFLAAQVRW
jgi:hypothetical protein